MGMIWAHSGTKRVFSDKGWALAFSLLRQWWIQNFLRGWAKGFRAPESLEGHLKLERALEKFTSAVARTLLNFWN